MQLSGGIPPRSSFALPDSLAALLAATTDADGIGKIKGCRAEDLQAVKVEAPEYGAQASELSAGAGGASTVTLIPPGRLIGRVQADDPSATVGLEVIAMTLPQGTAGSQISGQGQATTDAQGRFEIPALAAGKLHVNVLLGQNARVRPLLPSNLTIEPGKTTEVTIRLEGAANVHTVTGRVVDRGGQPVAGVDGVPVRRFPGANRNRDRREWAIRTEGRRRAVDVPVRP